MHTSQLFGIVALLCLGAAPAEDQQFTPEGFLLVKGQPHFVLGIYDLPKPASDAMLQEVAQSGFDFIRGEAKKETLDRLAANGLKGWIRLRSLDLPAGDAAARQRLADTVNQFKDHPGLFCWEGPDEALWRIYWKNHDWFFEEQPAKLKELIDKAAAAGNPNVAQYRQQLDKAIDYTGRTMWKEAEELYAKLWSELGATNPHPKMLMTASQKDVPEEGAAYARGWQVVAELDPQHPRWQNHAPCNSNTDRRLHNEGTNVSGCDIYPAPAYGGVRHGDLLPTMELTAVGAVTDLMRASATTKACWMVLQGCGWHDLGFNKKEPFDPVRGRRPNWQETHFMAYDAILHGATGVLYWGCNRTEPDSDLWKCVLRMGKELRALEPALVAPEAVAKPVVVAETNWTTFVGGDPKLLLRQVGNDWVLIAVNEWRTGVAFEIRDLPAELNGKTLYRLYSDEEHVVQNGGFRDGILGHDAQVYATSRRFEAK